MKKANQDIREVAKKNGIHLWQIGECLGLSDSSFSRRLRHELPEETKKEIAEIINSLADNTK